MQIKFKIIEVYPDEQLIVVRYYTDITPEEELIVQKDDEGKILRCRTDLSISLPNPVPTGNELNDFILSYCPVKFFEMKADVVAGNVNTTLENILALKDVEVAAPVVVPAVLTSEEITQQLLLQKESEYKAAVQKILDDAAQAVGYDNIISACSYAGYPNKYQAEALSFGNWRSAVWDYCTDFLNAINSGEAGIPTLEELITSLPTRELP